MHEEGGLKILEPMRAPPTLLRPIIHAFNIIKTQLDTNGSPAKALKTQAK